MRSMSTLRRSQRAFVFAVLFPVFLYIAVFVGFPLVMALYRSTTDTTGAFVGTANYAEFLFTDQRGVVTFRNTLLYALIRIPITVVLGFVIANALDRVALFRNGLVFLYFAPYVANMVAFSTVFMYLYANSGLFNSLLVAAGLPRMDFIRGLEQALPSIAVMDAWKHIGFDVIVFLSAMKAVPRQLYDAARIDGATGTQIMFKLKLPLLRPTVLFLCIVIFIWTMQVFEPIYIMTSGGPINATASVVLRIYESAFSHFRLGYASAIAFVLFGFVLTVTLLQLRFGRTDWKY